MWLAATFETDTRGQFLDLWAYMTNGKRNWPFSDWYLAVRLKEIATIQSLRNVMAMS